MNAIDQVISKLPEDAEFALAIVPAPDGEFRLIYLGMNHEEAAQVLYRCADELIRQNIPLPKIEVK